MGLHLGLLTCFTFAALSHLSTLLYMKVKDLTPRKYESMYEIAYLLFGRPSLFFVCIIMFATCYGALIIYYMILGDVLSSLCFQLILNKPYLSLEEDKITALEGYPWW